MGQSDKVANQSCSWSAEQGKLIFPYHRSRLRIWSRETGSAVPSRVSLLILHTQAEFESGVYSRDSSQFPRRRPFTYYLNRYTPSGQSQVYRVTQLRIDGFHCRESAGTRSVVLKVVPVTGAALAGPTMGQLLLCASLFPHPLLIWSGHVESIGKTVVSLIIKAATCSIAFRWHSWGLASYPPLRHPKVWCDREPHS